MFLVICVNVFVKIGGFVMFINGFGWYKYDCLVFLDDFVVVYKDYYVYMIDVFGLN